MQSPVSLPDAPAAGVEVEQVEDEETLAAFAEVYHLGWAATGRVPIAPWLTAPGWSLYLARFEGQRH
jgi:hypothetical protein